MTSIIILCDKWWDLLEMQYTVIVIVVDVAVVVVDVTTECA